MGSFTPGNGVWIINVVADFLYSGTPSSGWWNRISLSDASGNLDLTRVQDSAAITTGNTYTGLSSVIHVSGSTTWYIVARWGNSSFTIQSLTVRQTRIA